MIFIGSDIADSQPDPKAGSYCAAKHGLRGLISSVVAEGDSRDIRFFRPGYMDTALLPPNAKPRREGRTLLNPRDVAQNFVQWALDDQGKSIKTLEG